MRKFLFLLLFSAQQLFSEQDIKLLEISYLSFIHTAKLDNAYSVLKKIVEVKPNDRKWIKEMVKISFWIGDYKTWSNFIKKIPIEDIPQNQYNAIKLYFPDIYTEILLMKFKKEPSKENIFEIAKVAIKLNKRDLLKHLLRRGYLKVLENHQKQQIAQDIVMSELSELLIEHLDLFDKNTRCKIVSDYSKELFVKDAESSKKLLESQFNECLNHYDFLTTYIDVAKNVGDYKRYITLLETSYKNNLFRPQDAEEMILLNKDNKELVRDISLKSYKKFKLKYFLYYYLATDPQSIEEELDKELDEEIRLYFEIKNLQKLKSNERKKLLEKIKRMLKDNSFPSSYIWLITEQFNFKEKEELSPYLRCQKYNDKETLKAISYFKSSIAQANEALDCYKKLSIDEATELYTLSELYLLNGQFTESHFYKRKAYELHRNNDSLSPSQLAHVISLFEPHRFFLHQLKNEDIHKQEKDLLLANFYNNFSLTEKITKEIDNTNPYNLSIKVKEDILKINEKNLSPELYIDYYSKLSDIPHTFNWLYYTLDHSPQNPYSYSQTLSNIERFKGFRKISYNISNDRFVQKNFIKIELPVLGTFTFKATHSKLNLKRETFTKNTLEEDSISFQTNYKKSSLEISYLSSLNNFLSTRYTLQKALGRFLIKGDIGLSQKTNLTTFSDILLLEDYIRISLSAAHSYNTSTTFQTSLSNYKDRKHNYFSNSKVIQLNHNLRYRNIYTTIYSIYALYGAKKRDIAYNDIFKTPQKILPTDYFETGTTITLSFKNKSLSSTLAYNDKSKINYGFSINISQHIKEASKIDIELSHFKNYQNLNSPLTNLTLRYRF